MNNFVYSIISGILIGTCMILPGISGSVVAIMLGIYDQLIFILNDKNSSNFLKIKKLLPLTIGILIGIFIFGKVLLFFYNNYSFEMMYVFIGLIFGSIPILVNEVENKNEKISLKFILISLIFSLVIFIVPKMLNLKINNSLNIFNLFIGGFLYILGKLVPGISSSFFLMILGLYDYLLELVTNPLSIISEKLVTLLPFFFGIILGLYIFVKLINILLNKYFSNTYSLIIGFILGSVIAIFPGIEISIRGGFSFVLMLSSYFLVKKCQKKHKKIS